MAGLSGFTPGRGIPARRSQPRWSGRLGVHFQQPDASRCVAPCTISITGTGEFLPEKSAKTGVLDFPSRLTATRGALARSGDGAATLVALVSDERFGLVDRKRLARDVALYFRATRCGQSQPLLLGFHAFGDDAHPKVLR